MRRLPFPLPRGLAVALLLALGVASGSLAAQADTPSGFKICPDSKRADDTFALCATAKCWTMDGVAYCKCEVLHEKSISLPFHYRQKGRRKDVCDVLQAGVGNGFTVSTYATPRQLETDYNQESEKLGPPLALYTCPGENRGGSGYSAQCDGGLCFDSTRGTSFPGLGKVKKDQIVCSCPPVPSPPIGFQMTGPWSCDPGDRNEDGTCCSKSFHDKFCGVSSVSRTGTRIVVGAPTGVPLLLSKKLDGSLPKINRCDFE